jgi:anti-sigma regulatory factor (Ser/Thr protein kinase)
VAVRNEVVLPPDPASIRAARVFVAERATSRVDDVHAVALMTSELVANVVAHAKSDVTVRVDEGPPFRVEVHDSAGATEAFRAIIAEAPPPVDPTAMGGRGIGLVHALAKRVGLDDDPEGGKAVWFEV